MKKHRILTLALASLIGASANADHHAKKFVSIFDGKTLEGWTQRNGTATYEVKDETIVGTTKKGSPNSFLCSNKQQPELWRANSLANKGMTQGASKRTASGN